MDQKKCFEFTVTPAATAGCDQCFYQVCLNYDGKSKDCTKDGLPSHYCDAGKSSSSSVCAIASTADDGPLSWGPNLEGSGGDTNDQKATFTMCQLGKPGDTLVFLIKDGGKCSDSASGTQSDDLYSCAPSTAADMVDGKTCSGNGDEKECIWKYTIASTKEDL